MTKNIGKKAVFSGQDLWRKWLVGKTEIMNRWNSVWPKLLVIGILPSGKTTDDVLLLVF